MRISCSPATLLPGSNESTSKTNSSTPCRYSLASRHHTIQRVVRHHKILLPVLVSALTTHPMEPSPQAEQTVFEREDGANFRVGNRQTESSKSFAGQRTIWGLKSQAPTQRKSRENACKVLRPTSGKSGEFWKILPPYGAS